MVVCSMFTLYTLFFFQRRKLLIFFLFFLFPILGFSEVNSITWKGIYDSAVPLNRSLTTNYCEQHTPGIFLHTVKDALAHPLITEKGIKLDKASFHQLKISGIYVIYGDLLASRPQKSDVTWKINYFLYKFTEDGITNGIWYTPGCLGVYTGIAVLS